MVVDVVHWARRVDLSSLDSRALRECSWSLGALYFLILFWLWAFGIISGAKSYERNCYFLSVWFIAVVYIFNYLSLGNTHIVLK